MSEDRGIAIGFVLLAIAILIGGGVVLATRPEPVAITIIPPEPTATPPPTPTPAPLMVYITGAVNNPQQTVSVPTGSRVQDALEAVGGLTANADLSRVNMAGIVRDGDHIHVFAQGETEINPAVLPTPSGGDVVYINTATLEELDTLPGIGPAIAQRIIDYRTVNGPFVSMDDLQNVSGIGPATAENLEGLISFE